MNPLSGCLRRSPKKPHPFMSIPNPAFHRAPKSCDLFSEPSCAPRESSLFLQPASLPFLNSQGSGLLAALSYTALTTHHGIQVLTGFWAWLARL